MQEEVDNISATYHCPWLMLVSTKMEVSFLLSEAAQLIHSAGIPSGSWHCSMCCAQCWRALPVLGRCCTHRYGCAALLGAQRFSEPCENSPAGEPLEVLIPSNISTGNRGAKNSESKEKPSCFVTDLSV